MFAMHGDTIPSCSLYVAQDINPTVHQLRKKNETIVCVLHHWYAVNLHI